MKLNLGCGNNIRQGYLNVDCQQFPGVDRVMDINVLPLPFETDSVEEVVLQDILEHLDKPAKFLMEIARISRKGAKVYIRVPHFTSRNVWSDLEHKRGFTWTSFNTNKYMLDMFTIESRKITFSPIKCFMGPIANFSPIFYENFLRYFSAVNLEIVLVRK